MSAEDIAGELSSLSQEEAVQGSIPADMIIVDLSPEFGMINSCGLKHPACGTF